MGGLLLGPSPILVVAKTVTLISDDTGQSEEEISNKLLQNLSVQEAAGTRFKPQKLPDSESEYVTV